MRMGKSGKGDYHQEGKTKLGFNEKGSMRMGNNRIQHYSNCTDRRRRRPGEPWTKQTGHGGGTIQKLRR